MTNNEKIKELKKRGFEANMVIDNYGYCLSKHYCLHNIWYEIMVNKKGYVDIINHSDIVDTNIINVTLFKDFKEDLKFIIDNLIDISDKENKK